MNTNILLEKIQELLVENANLKMAVYQLQASMPDAPPDEAPPIDEPAPPDEGAVI